MVEFAVVVPIVLMILIGILQFGIVLHDYLAVTHAADVGARKVAVSANNPNGASVAVAAARAAVPNLQGESLGVTISPGAPFSSGTDVTVTVSYPYTINILGIIVASGDLHGTTVTRVE
jgi:Flp pilus assembly protein TadG